MAEAVAVAAFLLPIALYALSLRLPRDIGLGRSLAVLVVAWTLGYGGLVLAARATGADGGAVGAWALGILVVATIHVLLGRDLSD